MPWDEASRYWNAICELWRQSNDGREFAHPLVEKTLTAAAAQHPTTAADAALELIRNIPAALQEQIDALIQSVLTRLADWAERAVDAQLELLPDLCPRWRAVRPNCPIVERIYQRSSTPATQ